MGFDVYGIKPTSKNGEYFRDNVWYWKPMWNLVSYWCQDILSPEDIEQGYYNSGHEYSAETASKMREKIGEILKDTKKFKPLVAVIKKKWRYRDFNGKIQQYPFTWSNLTRFYRFLKDCNGFSIS